MKKRIIYLYYPALMLFLVFTFANSLLRGIIQHFSIELFLYIILWVFLTIQTTFAYTRIKNVKPENYPTKALLSDCLDILIAVYVCAAISGVYGGSENNELGSYLHLSIPFLILSINQFFWFVIVGDFDVPAIFRICILFIGMLAVSVSELLCHSLWNLVVIVALIVFLGILRAVDKAPKFFTEKVIKVWEMKKKKYFPE